MAQPQQLFIMTSQSSIGNHFMAQMRDIHVQKDSMRFRKNLERVGEILGYELSKSLSFKKNNVQTPLGTHSSNLIEDKIVLVTILRAALPMYQGFLNFFDNAENAFIGAYRGAHKKDHTFEVNLDYVASADLNDKIVIVIDPMLATGKSLVKACHSLFQFGKPKHVHIVSAIGSRFGINYLSQHLDNYSVWLGDLDEELNEKFYIVPGLGDAGDLSFGEKL
jgi:uracil phosphoribosyltransferase